MEYLGPPTTPEELVGLELASPEMPAIDIEAPTAPLARLEIGARADTFAPAREEAMPSPVDYGWSDTLGWEPFDLLRIEDLARVELDHAVVVQDLTSRRDMTGYVNITPLRVYGAGSGHSGLDALARYMRDYTRILVQVRQRQYDFFTSEDLLRDPVHFLIQGEGLPAHSDSRLTSFSDEEKELLGRYLLGGGFLFIEGSNRYLNEMAAHLEDILRGDLRLFPIPPEHGIYHAFYDFDGGFPSEAKELGEDVPASGLKYPTRREPTEVSPVIPLDPRLAVDGVVRLQPIGLWGVEVGGGMVAVLSDLDMHTAWGQSYDMESAQLQPVEMFLRAGTNVMAYALTRAGSIAAQRRPPAWAKSRPSAPVGSPGAAGAGSGAEQEEWQGLDGPDAVLDGSLALLRSPLATTLGRGGLHIRIDGRYSVGILDPHLHGVIIHNLPPGSRWLEITYGGKRAELEVPLGGGRVTTVTIGVSRLAFVSRIRVRQLESRLGPADWAHRFDDLKLDEVFVGDDRTLWENPGSP
ncbi:DUF4159 domain-containing protein [Candidatus Latescibacterota bacterium]